MWSMIYFAIIAFNGFAKIEICNVNYCSTLGDFNSGDHGKPIFVLY